MSFVLDPRLAADTLPIGDLALSRAAADERRALSLADPRPAPRPACATSSISPRRNARADRGDRAASDFLRALPGVDKLNVGALGNIVRQLHVHVVGRAVGDPAWPGPVWGVGEARAYAPEAAEALITKARSALIGVRGKP